MIERTEGAEFDPIEAALLYANDVTAALTVALRSRTIEASTAMKAQDLSARVHRLWKESQ